MKRIWLVVAAAALAACQTAAAPAVASFDARLREAAAHSGAPGMVAAIYRDGAIAEIYAWGGADCTGAGSADPFAAWEVGSISKEMTAVGVLKLWEQGLLDLDANVGAYLDDIPQAWRRVTLRQLLTHTSGVPDYEEAGGYGVYETSPTPQQVFDIVHNGPLEFEPGARWSYSNTNYFLLSLVIQRVSGMRFGDYMRARVFDPLGMHHTFVSGYAPAGVAIEPGCRPGEEANGRAGARIPVRPISEASTFGAGGILSTLQDWALWDDALRDGRLLSERGMRELTTPQRLANGEDTGYAFGLEIQPFRGERSISHSGQTQGFVALYQTFPARGAGVMVFANQYHANPGPVMNALIMRAVPELSYDRLALTADPDPARGALLARALRQAVLGEQPSDLLDADMVRFATEAGYAADRALMAPYVTGMQRLDYVQQQTVPGADGPRFLYRVTRTDGDTAYFRVGWREGKLHRLRWDDE
jgi:CubicO group peptidase (beta-lactamase class C family)